MPEFVNEETPGASPEQLRDERVAAIVEEPSLVDEVREEERRQREEVEKPLILGQYKSEAEAKAEFDRLKKEQEDWNREKEQYNQSRRVQEARAQDLKEQQEREKAQIERSQRSRQVRQLAADYMQKAKDTGNPEFIDKASELMEAYHAQNAALIARTMIDEALEPIQRQLSAYQLREVEEQFVAHPELQDIKHLSKQARQLYQKGWQPAEIVGFLREFNASSGGNTRIDSRDNEDNVVEMPNVREQTRRDARSLSPGGSTGGPRRSAFDQEKLAEAAQRRKFLEETLGPLPKRGNG